MTNSDPTEVESTDDGVQHVLAAPGKYKLTRDDGAGIYTLHQGPLQVSFADVRRDGDALALRRAGMVVADVDASQVPSDLAERLDDIVARSEARS